MSPSWSKTVEAFGPLSLDAEERLLGRSKSSRRTIPSLGCFVQISALLVSHKQLTSPVRSRQIRRSALDAGTALRLHALAWPEGRCPRRLLSRSRKLHLNGSNRPAGCQFLPARPSSVCVLLQPLVVDINLSGQREEACRFGARVQAQPICIGLWGRHATECPVTRSSLPPISGSTLRRGSDR